MVQIYTLDSYHCHIIPNVLPSNNRPLISIYFPDLFELQAFEQNKNFRSKFGKNLTCGFYKENSMKQTNN